MLKFTKDVTLDLTACYEINGRDVVDTIVQTFRKGEQIKAEIVSEDKEYFTFLTSDGRAGTILKELVDSPEINTILENLNLK